MMKTLYNGVLLVLFFPTLHLAVLYWEHEIGHGGHIYTLKINECFKSQLGALFIVQTSSDRKECECCRLNQKVCRIYSEYIVNSTKIEEMFFECLKAIM